MTAQQQSPQPDRNGPYNPYTLPRPPAPPSAGQGWVIVALLCCWPFALAALPHTLRASRALGAGDERTAAAEGARARRLGVWALAVGLSLSTLIVIGYLVAAFLVIAPLIQAETQDPAPAAEPGVPGSGPEDGKPVRELWDGRCYSTAGLTEVVARVEVTECDEPHGGEMYFETSLYDAYHEYDSPIHLPYPGETELARHAADTCQEKLDALRADLADFDIWYITPSAHEWGSGRYSLRCFAEARDGSSTGSIAKRASDE